MIALDTNILIYAFRADSPKHEPARRALEALIGSGRHLAIPWPCVHEFVAVTTNPRMPDPAPTKAALAAIRVLLEAPRVLALAESEHHLELLQELVLTSKVRGPRIHDARIAAICLGHGVGELWTADRDFSDFPSLAVHNPLVG